MERSRKEEKRKIKKRQMKKDYRYEEREVLRDEEKYTER